MASLKSNVDKLDINKLKNILTNLDNLRSKVDKLDVDTLLPVSVCLIKFSDIAENVVVKQDVYNAKINNIDDKIPNITILVTNSSLNAKINEIKGEIPSIINLATAAALIAIKNKIPNISNLVKKKL